MPADWLQVRAPGVCFYVLHDRDQQALYLIDTGCWLGSRQLRRALRNRGWENVPIQGILLTHGHLDHALNVSRFAKETGAWVAAPAKERLHLAGQFPYQGVARTCGWLEAVGRKLWHYEVPDLDAIQWFEPEDQPFADVWGGLLTVPLPGHTEGHTGYYSRRHRLLFCGDLFASHSRHSHFPPAIFNSCPEHFPATVEHALSLDLQGICPCHGDKADPSEHLRRWRDLAAKSDRIPR